MTDAKRRAAVSAVERVESGMVVGLGSGSTAAHAITELGRRVDDGLEIVGVPTSYQSAEVARTAGVPVRDLADVPRVDIAIDGADQVADGQLVKGGGGAHAREKVVDRTADRLAIVVDRTKLTDVLDVPVPLEVLPMARRPVVETLRGLGGDPTLRSAAKKSGPVISDNGNFVLDCDFGRIESPEELAGELAGIPGVVDHGLFVDLADEVHVGGANGVHVFEP